MPLPGLLWLPAAALACLGASWGLLRLATALGGRRLPTPGATLALGAALYAGAGLAWALPLAVAFGHPPLSALAAVLWPPTDLWRPGLWPVWVADRLGLFGFRLG